MRLKDRRNHRAWVCSVRMGALDPSHGSGPAALWYPERSPGPVLTILIALALILACAEPAPTPLALAQAAVADAEVALQQSLADADVARKQLRNTPSPSDLALK